MNPFDDDFEDDLSTMLVMDVFGDDDRDRDEKTSDGGIFSWLFGGDDSELGTKDQKHRGLFGF